jgi:hypothetical protein
MTDAKPTRFSGGCQCGAVRYELVSPPDHASICYCRMCQKASGQPFMAFCRVKAGNIKWTRGELSIFKSSNVVERGFCDACGTPLTYRFVEGGNISVTICSLDEPETVRPQLQFGVESKLSWASSLNELPTKRTDEWMRADRVARLVSHQHPDRERE